MGLTLVLGHISSANPSKNLVFSTPLGVGVPFPAAFVRFPSVFSEAFYAHCLFMDTRESGLLEHMTSRQDEKRYADSAAAEVHRMRKNVFFLRRNGNYAWKK